MTNLQVWCYTLGLILVWLVVMATSSESSEVSKLANQQKSATATSSSAEPNSDESQLWNILSKDSKTHEQNCKNLCGHCGCMPFYCGEECICECNKDSPDTKCIDRTLQKAKNLNIPYELLMQGPTKNKIMKTAFQYDVNAMEKMRGSVAQGRNKRSTVTIYKPNPKILINQNDSDINRIKRAPNPASNNELDWFNDFASGLVKPAPIPSKNASSPKKNNEASNTSIEVKDKELPAQLDVDRSWFAENNNKSLVRPAPIAKRQSSRRNSFQGLPDPLAMVERIPKVIKNTLKTLQESGDEEDEFTQPIKSLQNLFKNSIKSRNEKQKDPLVQMTRWGDSIVDTFEKLLEKSKLKQPTTTTTPAPVEGQMGPFLMQWLQPDHLLQRFQNVLNQN